MFEGYQTAFDTLQPIADDDIIVMCHDDIEIITDGNEYQSILKESLNDPKIGFVGVAGTTYLDKDAVWWEMERRQKGLHSGFVFQGVCMRDSYPNWFGPWRNVVALDGCFIATKARTIRKIGFAKPKQFPGNWDFYDLHYTVTAYEMGYVNKTVPIITLHNSEGQLVGRDSWHANRKEFIKMHRLPVWCKNE
jgi:glycosyltransferase involved in cell wall biosynthesis